MGELHGCGWVGAAPQRVGLCVVLAANASKTRPRQGRSRVAPASRKVVPRFGARLPLPSRTFLGTSLLPSSPDRGSFCRCCFSSFPASADWRIALSLVLAAIVVRPRPSVSRLLLPPFFWHIVPSRAATASTAMAASALGKRSRAAEAQGRHLLSRLVSPPVCALLCLGRPEPAAHTRQTPASPSSVSAAAPAASWSTTRTRTRRRSR